MMKDLKEKQDGHQYFDRVLEWLRDDKIDVTYDEYMNNYQIRFSHPSYYEAFQQAISNKGVLTKIGEILSSVLFKLADNKDRASDVAYAITKNFDKLPENVRNELL
ncbi:MAG: hypothetical protein JO327_04870, partial [Nitrososphaeraceae archaeon]|nr:hypothetical protein [Nitrososphaeraceae archaeon]